MGGSCNKNGWFLWDALFVRHGFGTQHFGRAHVRCLYVWRVLSFTQRPEHTRTKSGT